VSKLKIFIESELNMYFRLWYGNRKLNASNRSITRRERYPCQNRTRSVAPTIIKNEPYLDEQNNSSYRMLHVAAGTQAGTSSTRTSHNNTGHEVIEILSDSEDERPALKTENVSTARTSSGEKKQKVQKPARRVGSNAGCPLTLRCFQRVWHSLD
jgi:hypothetical protein